MFLVNRIVTDSAGVCVQGFRTACIGKPSDISGTRLFLTSDPSKYCDGITFDQNGGMLIR